MLAFISIFCTHRVWILMMHHMVCLCPATTQAFRCIFTYTHIHICLDLNLYLHPLSDASHGLSLSDCDTSQLPLSGSPWSCYATNFVFILVNIHIYICTALTHSHKPDSFIRVAHPDLALQSLCCNTDISCQARMCWYVIWKYQRIRVLQRYLCFETVNLLHKEAVQILQCLAKLSFAFGGFYRAVSWCNLSATPSQA